LIFVTKRKFNIRKMVTLSPEFWEKINDFRFRKRVSTETEAIRILIEAGLSALEEKNTR